jgi:ribosome recycling factor
MAYDFSKLRTSSAETKDWLSKEFDGIRTGRAAPAILDTVKVEAYGTLMPLSQVASVSIEDARTLRVSPWDAQTLRAVEKAISTANLGVGSATDERGIRVTFPELTSERRTQLIKLAKERLEQARVTLRKAREETQSDIQAKEKAGEISEDDKFRAKDEMQKIVDQGNTALDDLFKKKETELTA